ncbi:hypothetical protein F8M41_025006 [Gigaspora margarita]|uniref:Uncharacterized protein n=1 Tax=Gigaspora margarita TaxID=4874 RepID=A0A8H4ABQ9_GIGMA|nr:hypothetical protein F8M41_025006 [Gigaspora margarita]
MHRQLEDLHINKTKMEKAIKKNSSKPKSSPRKTKSKLKSSDSSDSEKNSSKPKSSCRKTKSKSKSKTKKKKLEQSKHVNSYIISDESTSDSSNSENSITSSENELETKPKTSSKKSSASSNKKIIFSHILQPISDLIRIASQQANTLSQKAPEEIQQEAEISWPNHIEINFIHKIIPNDVATITCQIISPSGKNIQVPGALIDSRANCSLKSKGLAKLKGMNIDKNKKPSVISSIC